MFTRLRESHAFKREYLIVLALLFNAFSSYFFGYVALEGIARDLEDVVVEVNLIPLRIAYPLAILFSALVGALVSRRIDKFRFLLIWLIIGTVAPFSLTASMGQSMFMTIISTIFLGASLGIGMPVCLSRNDDAPMLWILSNRSAQRSARRST